MEQNTAASKKPWKIWCLMKTARLAVIGQRKEYYESLVILLLTGRLETADTWVPTATACSGPDQIF